MTGLLKIGLAATLSATACLGLAAGVKWNTDLATALKIAKRTKKPVMIDFYGET